MASFCVCRILVVLHLLYFVKFVVVVEEEAILHFRALAALKNVTSRAVSTPCPSIIITKN